MTARPLPWLQSSRGYAVWCQTDANGTRFDLAGERISISTRARAGPLRLDASCAPRRRPAGCVRFCRLTGFPALLPEWGYGFWKSRDVHEHQDDVLDDYEGFRRHGIPLDAIVIDSPWATQYNTWEFNPYQFPDAPGMIATTACRRGAHRRLGDAVGQPGLPGRPDPAPAGVRAPARPPGPELAPAAAAGHFVAEADGESHVGQWWMGTGSPIDLTSPAAERGGGSGKRVLELGVEGIKADDGDGFYIPDEARLADGRPGLRPPGSSAACTGECLQRALDEVHPGQRCALRAQRMDRPACHRADLGRRPGV